MSNDPKFEDKLIDVVGLYLNPPEKAIVLCMDEKSQIQALDRTQASLPMVAGRAGTMTHDYKRNGTTTLFAALDVLTGTVIGQCLPRHRHTEFIKFLNTIDREVPDGLQIHLILDNYSTHKHAEVDRWLKRHKRFHLHFTPTSSSWLNQVERWFRDLTDKNLRRGVFGSVPDLIASIEEYLNAHNADPRPYVWTATAESILAKVQRARTKLEQVVSQNVSIGGYQSNHTRQVAAVAARLGMKARLVQERWVDWPDVVNDKVGNILLSRIMGADVRLDPAAGFGIGIKDSWEAALEEVRAAGGVPYGIPAGASEHPLGGLGFANWAYEVQQQEQELGSSSTRSWSARHRLDACRDDRRVRGPGPAAPRTRHRRLRDHRPDT